MNILITGSDGFVGKNLFNDLLINTNHNVFPFTKAHLFEDLEKSISRIDIVFHFAGINKALENCDFEKVNVGLTKRLCRVLEKSQNTTLIYASSTQAKLDNNYGRSKKKSEEICLNQEKIFGNKVYIMRLPGIFGIGCKPNYNSVVSTFCFNSANEIELKIVEPKKEIELLYQAIENNYYDRVYYDLSDLYLYGLHDPINQTPDVGKSIELLFEGDKNLISAAFLIKKTT